MYFVDQINLVAALGRRITHVVAQFAHVLDTVVAGTVDFDDIKTIPRGNLAAVVTNAARRSCWSVDAIQRLS